MDVRNSLDRLKPVQLRVCTLPESNELFCELKKRIFFKLDVFDDDFFPKVYVLFMILLAFTSKCLTVKVELRAFHFVALSVERGFRGYNQTLCETYQ